MQEAMLTTFDNPHSPFDDFNAWYAFDVRSGYRTTELLARITVNSEELSSADQRAENERAIDEIVSENVSGMHRKVTREVPDPYESETVAE